MAQTEAIAGYGTTIFYGDLPAGPASTQLAVEIKTIPLPELEADDIDVTHMESPDRTREFIAGLKDGGELEFECNYTRTGYAAAIALHGTSKWWRIVLSNSDQFEFPAYIKNVGAEADVEEAVMMTVTMKVAGASVFTPGA